MYGFTVHLENMRIQSIRHIGLKSSSKTRGQLLEDDAPVKIGMKPSHPGEFLREEILNELGLSVARAAEVLGVRRATLSDLVNERAALSPEMAMRFEKAFGVSMDTLLRMQAWHDGYTMRQREADIDVKKFTPPAGPR
jgi:addiction module HigA family antidote